MPDSPAPQSSAPSASGAAKAAGLDGAPFTEADLLALPLVTRATIFAAWMHRKQKRKYGGGEYIAHPMTVASTVGVLGAGSEAVAAALL
ncbi:MAG TPA: hypothetical protein VL860_00830, partial [Planctomycetota bacterium]|nr:hypothetical protein [Planctomycetota bacterium]